MNILNVLGAFEAASQLYNELKAEGMTTELKQIEVDVEDIIKVLESAKAKADVAKIEAMGSQILTKIKGAL